MPSDGDLETVELSEEGEAEMPDLPMVPVDPEEIDLDDAEVMGAVGVNDEDFVMSVRMDIHTLTTRFDAAEVNERLEPGAYALVRVEVDW